MSRNGMMTTTLMVCFLAVALPCAADPVAAGLKFGLEKSVGALAGMGYKTNCKAKNLEFKSDDSWYCGVFASLSGQDKAEFEERVKHNLAKIRESLTNIENGITQIQAGQEAIYNQNRQILLRLDEVGPETTIGQHVSHIRTVYKEQYAKLFTGATLNADRMRNFAHQVIFIDKMHDRLGVINDQLTATQIAGREPLLRAYAKRAYDQIKANPNAGLEPAYVYLESAVDGLLADQRKGYLLYIWATETLQSDCEVAQTEAAAAKISAADADKRCKDFREFPHTPDEYRSTFADHVRAQMAELNAGLEYQVLAASDTHARAANFLPPAAGPLFTRADLFTAGNLEEGYGIHGRVISMGDAFDGNVLIAGGVRAPSGVPTLVSANGRVDWWKATSKALTYDELHLGDQWKVYHYHLPTFGAGSYAIDTPLPYRPQITVAPIELGTGGSKTTVPFGNFTAIERAGGGYALLSGDWVQAKDESTTTVGDLHSGWNELVYDPAKLQAGIMYSGSLEWKTKNVPKDQYIAVERKSYAQSSKRMRYPRGGELTLRVDFGDTLPKTCPGGACADYSNNEVLKRFADLSKPAFGGRSAEVSVRAAFLIDIDTSSSNGLVWEKNNSFDTSVNDNLQAGKETTKIRLDNNGKTIYFGGRLKMNMQTSTTSESRWIIFALTFIENAYLTE